MVQVVRFSNPSLDLNPARLYKSSSTNVLVVYGLTVPVFSIISMDGMDGRLVIDNNNITRQTFILFWGACCRLPIFSILIPKRKIYRRQIM